MPVSVDLEPRTYFRTLDAAMADFELPLGAVDRARLAVRGLDFEHVYIPDTRDYIALEIPGRSAPVAFVTSFYVALHPVEGPSEFVQIAEPAPEPDPEPVSQPQSAAATARAPRAKATRASAASTNVTPTKAARLAAQRARVSEPVTAACPTCYTHLPATGNCDWCG